MLKEKIEEIIDAVFLHGRDTPSQSYDLPDMQLSEVEAVNELITLFAKFGEEIISSPVIKIDTEYKSFIIDELVGEVVNYQRKKLKKMIGEK